MAGIKMELLVFAKQDNESGPARTFTTIAMVEANDKDDEIRDLLSWLRSRLGQNFVVIDHWESDRSAVGVAATDDPRQLVYIASRGQTAGPYFVELEASPSEGSDLPYTMVGRFEAVDREQLLRITAQHLNTGISEPSLANGRRPQHPALDRYCQTTDSQRVRRISDRSRLSKEAVSTAAEIAMPGTSMPE